MCNGCKYFIEDTSVNACDCKRCEEMTEEQFEKYFGNDEDGCPFREMEKVDVRICPICGCEYSDYPALSRKDNKTYICPQCGMQEALEDYFRKGGC